MTLVWLALTLAVIVFGGVYLTWDLRTQFRRQERARTLGWTRQLRRPEDEAWARFRVETAVRAAALNDAFTAQGATDMLAALFDQPAKLEVVA